MIRYDDKKVQLTSDVSRELAQFWRNQKEVYQWCRQNTLISKSHNEAYWNHVETNPSIKMFSIQTVEGQAVGVCGLTSIDLLNQKAEFSLYIAPKFQGHGLGTDALYTLLRHGFEDFNLNRIWGETFEGNPALKMFDKLGLVREGCQRQAYYRGGRYLDSLIVSTLREEFFVKHGLFQSNHQFSEPRYIVLDASKLREELNKPTFIASVSEDNLVYKEKTQSHCSDGSAGS